MLERYFLWYAAPVRCFFYDSDFNIETSIVDIGATFVELYGTRFVFFFFPAANTHCRLIGAMNKVRLKKDQTLQKVLIVHKSLLWVVCLASFLVCFLMERKNNFHFPLWLTEMNSNTMLHVRSRTYQLYSNKASFLASYCGNAHSALHSYSKGS